MTSWMSVHSILFGTVFALMICALLLHSYAWLAAFTAIAILLGAFTNGWEKRAIESIRSTVRRTNG